jgi:hypothetical protein
VLLNNEGNLTIMDKALQVLDTQSVEGGGAVIASDLDQNGIVELICITSKIHVLENTSLSTVVVRDIIADGNVDLIDAVSALQVLSGTEPFSPVHNRADVNGDGQIGLGEVIYIFQEVSGM